MDDDGENQRRRRRPLLDTMQNDGRLSKRRRLHTAFASDLPPQEAVDAAEQDVPGNLAESVPVDEEPGENFNAAEQEDEPQLIVAGNSPGNLADDFPPEQLVLLAGPPGEPILPDYDEEADENDDASEQEDEPQLIAIVEVNSTGNLEAPQQEYEPHNVLINPPVEPIVLVADEEEQEQGDNGNVPQLPHQNAIVPPVIEIHDEEHGNVENFYLQMTFRVVIGISETPRTIGKWFPYIIRNYTASLNLIGMMDDGLVVIPTDSVLDMINRHSIPKGVRVYTNRDAVNFQNIDGIDLCDRVTNWASHVVLFASTSTVTKLALGSFDELMMRVAANFLPHVSIILLSTETEWKSPAIQTRIQELVQRGHRVRYHPGQLLSFPGLAFWSVGLC